MIRSNVSVAWSRFDKNGWIPLSHRDDRKTNLTYTYWHVESLQADQKMSPARDVLRRWNQTNESRQKKFPTNSYNRYHPDSYFADGGRAP